MICHDTLNSVKLRAMEYHFWARYDALLQSVSLRQQHHLLNPEGLQAKPA